ncbi:MAG: MarR family transcriptional regulator [Thermoleophilia bacterium]|nr:MarR family transcriptional regulator [Thermoleophilia bacterium]
MNDVQAKEVDDVQVGAVPNPRELISFIFQVCTTYDRFTGQMRRAFGLNAHERIAIAMLWERGPMTMSELGAWIPLSRAAVTTLVDRLEDAGLVARGTDPVDRRRTVVRHTELSETRMVPVIGPWIQSMIELADSHAENWPIIEGFLNEFREATNGHAQQLVDMSDAAIHKLAESAPAVSS